MCPTRRASRANLRGFPNDSRYSRITVVSGSWSQNCSRSLLLTSALLPIDTNVETPSPSPAAWPSSSMPSAPDCDANPIWPRTGRNGANVAFIEMSGSVLTTPMPFGPDESHAVPAGQLDELLLASRRSPRSANPALITMSPCTPLSAHSCTTVGTDAAGHA